jgi:hypothetical protein
MRYRPIKRTSNQRNTGATVIVMAIGHTDPIGGLAASTARTAHIMDTAPITVPIMGIGRIIGAGETQNSDTSGQCFDEQLGEHVDGVGGFEPRHRRLILSRRSTLGGARTELT